MRLTHLRCHGCTPCQSMSHRLASHNIQSQRRVLFSMRSWCLSTCDGRPIACTVNDYLSLVVSSFPCFGMVPPVIIVGLNFISGTSKSFEKTWWMVVSFTFSPEKLTGWSGSTKVQMWSKSSLLSDASLYYCSYQMWMSGINLQNANPNRDISLLAKANDIFIFSSYLG